MKKIRVIEVGKKLNLEIDERLIKALKRLGIKNKKKILALLLEIIED
jgi:hypothetical protein